MPSSRVLPPDLEFDREAAVRDATAFLRQRLDEPGLACYVLGLSGGVDSSLSAALAVRAVGPERLVTVKLPYRTSQAASREDAQATEDALGIPAEHRLLVDISPIVDGWQSAVQPSEETLARRRGNVAARARMVVLWDLAARFNGTVLGTENRTENLLGYFTIYGDSGTAVEPIHRLYKSQVWALAEHLGVPEQVVQKDPTADLWANQTDEGELGLRYVDADLALSWAFDRGVGWEHVAERSGLTSAVVDSVRRRYEATEFKRAVPYRLGE